MQKILYFVLLLLMKTNSWSQLKTVQGQWNVSNSKGTHQGFVMRDSNYIYSVEYQDSKLKNEQRLIASLYDNKTLAFHNSFEIIPAPALGSTVEMTQFFSINQYMVLVMVESKKEKPEEKRILLQLIHADGTRGNPVVADTLPSYQNVNDDFHVVVDERETGFLICTNYPVSSDENQRLKITAFSTDLIQKWSKTVEFPNKETQYILTDWRYDGADKVFFLSRHSIDMYHVNQEFSSAKQNTYFLWGYDHGKDKLKEIELSLNQRFINKITIEQDKNRWLVVGLFSNNHNLRSDGVFNLILDSTWQVISHKLHDFTEIENRIFSEENVSKVKANGAIQVKSIERFANGEFVLVGEEFYKEIDEPNDDRMSTTNFTEIFHYKNISFFWFDSFGNLKSINSIPKNQVSVNDQGKYSSYSIAKQDENLFLFFNDQTKHNPPVELLNDRSRPISGFRKLYLKTVQINNKGIQRNQVVQSPNRKARICPSKGVQFESNTVYFLNQKNRKNALLAVELVK